MGRSLRAMAMINSGSARLVTLKAITRALYLSPKQKLELKATSQAFIEWLSLELLLHRLILSLQLEVARALFLLPQIAVESPLITFSLKTSSLTGRSTSTYYFDRLFTNEHAGSLAYI